MKILWASLWYENRIKNEVWSEPIFSLCCMQGKAVLLKLAWPLFLLFDLLQCKHEDNKDFVENMHAYNMMFAFTSIGDKADASVNHGSSPYVYRINGHNYHLLESLSSQASDNLKFAQLYIYDIDHEILNRIQAIRLVNFIMDQCFF